MLISTAIVAHPSRKEIAEELAELVSGRLVWDEHGRGCEHTHSSALSTLLLTVHNRPRRWFVVLEDDALVREDFTDQLDEVLAVAPSDFVGLYLGTGYPRQWQATLQRRVSPLDEDSCFLMLPQVLNMVGYAVRAELAGSLADQLYRQRTLNRCSDQIATSWLTQHGLQAAYTRPSIVDHRQDVDPVITTRHDGQDRSRPRRAWRYGGRKFWQNTAVAIPAPKPVRIDEQGEWYEIEGGGTFNVG